MNTAPVVSISCNLFPFFRKNTHTPISRHATRSKPDTYYVIKTLEQYENFKCNIKYNQHIILDTDEYTDWYIENRDKYSGFYYNANESNTTTNNLADGCNDDDDSVDDGRVSEKVYKDIMKELETKLVLKIN